MAEDEVEKQKLEESQSKKAKLEARNDDDALKSFGQATFEKEEGRGTATDSYGLGSDEDDDEEEDDDMVIGTPARDCITFHLYTDDKQTQELSDANFQPEFTHQYFQDEVIPRGYSDVQIKISMSGPTATYALNVSYIQEDEDEEEETAGREEVKKTDRSPPNTKKIDGSTTTTITTNHNKLLSCLQPFIPPSTRGCPCVVNGIKGRLMSEEGFVIEETAVPAVHEEDLSISSLPLGKELEIYTVVPRNDGANDSSFDEIEYTILHAVRTEDRPGITAFHRRAQKLAPWFIENGDDVDPERGEWEFLYLVRRSKRADATDDAEPPCLAGYLTLYAFNNPLKGKSIRVCQVLVLPPFQRQGHGQHLLRQAYRLAREREVVYEVTVKDPEGFTRLRNVTVEDPAEGFTMLRNVTDVQDLAKALEAHQNLLGDLMSRTRFDGQKPPRTVRLSIQAILEITSYLLVHQSFHHQSIQDLFGNSDLMSSMRFDCLTLKDISAVQVMLKITKNQVILAYECLKWKQAPPQNEERHKAFRLMIKRRLAKEVQGMYVNQREALQAYLDRLFQGRLAECRDIMIRAKLMSKEDLQ